MPWALAKSAIAACTLSDAPQKAGKHPDWAVGLRVIFPVPFVEPAMSDALVIDGAEHVMKDFWLS